MRTQVAQPAHLQAVELRPPSASSVSGGGGGGGARREEQQKEKEEGETATTAQAPNSHSNSNSNSRSRWSIEDEARALLGMTEAVRAELATLRDYRALLRA